MLLLGPVAVADSPFLRTYTFESFQRGPEKSSELPLVNPTAIAHLPLAQKVASIVTPLNSIPVKRESLISPNALRVLALRFLHARLAAFFLSFPHCSSFGPNF